MERIVLPSDVKAYVRNKIFKRVFKCAVGEIIVILFLILFGSRVFDSFGIINKTIIYILLLTVPFLISGIPFKLIDRYWSGEIVDIKVITRSRPFNKYGGRTFAVYDENAIILFIKEHNTNVIIEEALALGVVDDKRLKFYNHPIGKIENHLDDYRIGDNVYHFYGIDNLLIRHKTNDDSVKCVVCGIKNPTVNDKCNCCGYTLVK